MVILIYFVYHLDIRIFREWWFLGKFNREKNYQDGGGPRKLLPDATPDVLRKKKQRIWARFHYDVKKRSISEATNLNKSSSSFRHLLWLLYVNIYIFRIMGHKKILHCHISTKFSAQETKIEPWYVFQYLRGQR